MRAVIMDAPGRMRVGQWETAEIGPDDVRVSVGAVGICAGDLYVYQGKNPYASYPAIAGHEIAGTVAEVGAGVTGLTVGTAVVIEPFLGCGHCYPCRIGKANCCANLEIIGLHRPGGFAEYVAAPADHVHRIPSGLSLPFASFAEPVAIGVQACRRGDIRAGEYVLILGCGPIGLALIEVAKARGAHVVASDVVPSRLDMVARIGADVIPAGADQREAVLGQTGGEGAAVVMEATGNPQVMESTVDLVAAGGRIVIVGLVKQGIGVSLPGLDFTRKEMTVLGSRASVGCFPEALSLLAGGAITYPRVATEFPLWDAPPVFARLAADPAAIHKGVLIHQA